MADAGAGSSGSGPSSGPPPDSSGVGQIGGGPPPPPTPEQLALLPHDNLGPALIAIVWIFGVLATVFLSLRVYCKISRNGRLWWDDGILIASYLCLLVSVCITTYLTTLGIGKHIWDFPVQNFALFLLPVDIRGTFSITALAWSKTSFGITLLHLTTGWMRYVVWFIIITVNLSLFFSATLPWVQCRPLSAFWDVTVLGTCWDKNILFHYNLFSGAYSGAMDFALALLPWKLLMGLRMRRKEKVGAAIAMSMGVMAGIAAIVKTVYLPTLYGNDIYDSVQLFIWDTVEASVTIVAASIPTLRVLIRDAKKNRSTKGTGQSTSAGRFQVSKYFSNAFSNRSEVMAGEKSGVHMQIISQGGQTDSRSDKSILGDIGNLPNDSSILRTQTVSVEYDKRRSRDYDIEMGRVAMRKE
ncbi:hypothetical protein QBC47DRAFT_308354 [Echria macrotheca]|uniref:Rhodopsin domain-containing protein n=1 Tax=Echria macrotheca TaxID=438768 RepID=A0AAJ0F7E1_9PEZI|nr:hypothetical protein QBC47DRAFT_308354 [Echria macrotheca]